MKKLEWGSCFSYGPTNSIDLNKATITQLIGENGSGKSSIPLILEEVAFNKNSKGVKKSDIANREIGDGKYWIKLFFDLDDQEYSIILNRASTLKVKVYKGEEDISSHTATDTFKTIEGLFGIDFKVFVQLIYQSVNDGLSFLTATDTVRKKFLIDLFNLGEYSKYYDLFKEKVQDLTKSVASAKGSISALEKMLAKNSDIPEYKFTKVLPEKPEYPSEIGEFEAQIRDILNINKKIEQNNQLRKILKSIVVDNEYVGKESINTQELTMKVGELTAKVSNSKAFISKMAKLSDSCPTCGGPIDISKEKILKEEAEETLRQAEQELKNYNLELKEAKEHNAKVLAARKARDERDDLILRIDHDMGTELLSASSIKEVIDVLKNDYAKLEQEYTDAVKYNSSVDQHNSRIEIMLKQKQETEEELEFEKVNLENLMHRQSVFEILKKAFSTNGLVAFKLENLVKDIEYAANEYLLELSDGRFSLMFTISGDKLNVTLVDNNNEIDISALSSGELARVNIATLLAIRRIMSDISKTQINVLFLDEVINVLDEYGREKLIEVLLEEKSLNTFLVSHGWSHPLLNKVLVKKVDGISYLTEQ